VVRVKICGLREPGHAVAAAEAGEDFVGLVFAPSPRRVTVEEAQRIAQALRALLRPPLLVGVFANTPSSEVNETAAFLGLDLVQLSGDEDRAYCRQIIRPIIERCIYTQGTRPKVFWT
jgi:phosphoribosylanthranilate isomerase